MIIIPAIDIIDGKCVRLSQGNYDSCKVYSDSPVQVAKAYEQAGFSRLHVVDLETVGALEFLELLSGSNIQPGWSSWT